MSQIIKAGSAPINIRNPSFDGHDGYLTSDSESEVTYVKVEEFINIVNNVHLLKVIRFMYCDEVYKVSNNNNNNYVIDGPNSKCEVVGINSLKFILKTYGNSIAMLKDYNDVNDSVFPNGDDTDNTFFRMDNTPSIEDKEIELKSLAEQYISKKLEIDNIKTKHCETFNIKPHYSSDLEEKMYTNLLFINDQTPFSR